MQKSPGLKEINAPAFTSSFNASVHPEVNGDPMVPQLWLQTDEPVIDFFGILQETHEVAVGSEELCMVYERFDDSDPWTNGDETLLEIDYLYYKP